MSKIIVIGGTGYAGAAIVKVAHSRGHEVTAVSRSAPPMPEAGVTYLAADAASAISLVDGAQVVIAALSPRGENAGKLLEIYQQLANASAKANARFIAIGGFSALRPAAGAPRFAESGDIPPAYLAEAKEMYAILTDLEAGATATDWLFVSPAAEFGAFAPGQALGSYRVADDIALFDAAGKSAISGVDFARAVVDEIEKPTRHGAQIHFAY